ncbi:uncharacterized protein J4E88_001291 [Alternaria novae-zelandiae]|uniref:uncharacterized protein n=1 Tax=Alternaria novae-zelandiae TaxID=430562 RepID=UPI0020C43A27|nr:uncharacterized protein J4E88_001291 [Alternaria novae-zelandiae]KAI4692921.1 hypothetical protein J4E88_001291 [Alternaria novae-zelandiae]
MASKVIASDAQKSLFRNWAQDSVFILDTHDSTKRQFCLLAKMMGWVGGEETWNDHWHECFGEVYIWRAFDSLSTSHEADANAVPDDATGTSVSNATPTPSDSGGVRASDIWYQFEGFFPDHTASFNNEFWRFCKHMRWSREERREARIEIFDADWEAHMGSDLGSLARWQDFCRLCSLDIIPDSIPGCMEVLAEVLVNIYDLLDSQRTGSDVFVFQDFKEFRKYTLNGRRYPLDEAKGDTFLPIFLKEVL